MSQKTCLFLTPFFLVILLVLSFSKLSIPLPLSTSSRWILDESTRNRVKLTCINWVGHLEPLIIEGLQKKPVSYIANQIVSMGFNCVRLTWATYMFTRPNYTALTIATSLDKFGLKEAKVGIGMNNPEFLNLSLIEGQKKVIEKLGTNGIMVVLDNHVSKPQWCCSENDGNGFFGDVFFDPSEWLQGLSSVAKLYKDIPNVSPLTNYYYYYCYYIPVHIRCLMYFKSI